MQTAKTLMQVDNGAMPICGDDDRLKDLLSQRDIAVKRIAQGKSSDDNATP